MIETVISISSMEDFSMISRTDIDHRVLEPYYHCLVERFGKFFTNINRAWDHRKKNRKKYWNRSDNKP